ncbi:hypothetical protein BC826DRAFT_1050496, partial [Russula brevipes]
MMTMMTWSIQCLAGVATSAVQTLLYCGGFVRTRSLHEGVWRHARTVLDSVVGVEWAQAGPPWSSPGVKVRG